jgi:hypothetical protein
MGGAMTLLTVWKTPRTGSAGSGSGCTLTMTLVNRAVASYIIDRRADADRKKR